MCVSVNKKKQEEVEIINILYCHKRKKKKCKDKDKKAKRTTPKKECLQSPTIINTKKINITLHDASNFGVYAIVCELFPFPLRFSISKDATVSAFVVRFFLLRHNFVLMPQYRHITPSTTPNTAIAKIPARNKTINKKK